MKRDPHTSLAECQTQLPNGRNAKDQSNREKKMPKDTNTKIGLKHEKYQAREINAALRREIKPIG